MFSRFGLDAATRWMTTKDDFENVIETSDNFESIAMSGSSSKSTKSNDFTRKELPGRSVPIASPADNTAVDNMIDEDFVVCDEYGENYEDTTYEVDDEEASNSSDSTCVASASGSSEEHRCRISGTTKVLNVTDGYFGSEGTAAVNENENEAGEEETPQTIFLLGKSYLSIKDFESRREDESSLFWFTHRCNFPEIVPYRITSDAGWGCMLRSAQMLLAQSLRLHFRSREWRPPRSIAQRQKDPFLRTLLTWFADFPSSTDCIYSMHNMVAVGLSKYKKSPGKWYGPKTACHVLRDLVTVHEQLQICGRVKHEQKIFRVHVVPQGSLFSDAVQDLMTRTVRARLEKKKQQQEKKKLSLSSLLTDADFLPSQSTWEKSSTDSEHQSSSDLEWDTSLLLLVPLQLGLQNFSNRYMKSLAFIFSLRQSVGVLAGHPGATRWLYGATSDGNKVYGLDPSQTIQSAPNQQNARVNGKASSIVHLSEDYLRSVHTTMPEFFSLQNMEANIALGFYCQNAEDFQSLLDSIKGWQQSNPTLPNLFSMADNDDHPKNSSSCAAEGTEHADRTNTEEIDGVDDEDEYVTFPGIDVWHC